MPNSVTPTNIGYLPTGVNGVAQTSTVFLGRATASGYDGVGLGANGRPDYAQVVQINLTNRTVAGGVATLTQAGSIILNVADLVAARTANPNISANLSMTLREVAVCDGGVSKRMMVICSAPYAASS